MGITKIKIQDATLREGEQTPNVKLTYKQKLSTAKMLDQLGVDFIEIGNPSISNKDKHDLRKIAKNKFKANLICHSRALKKDIDNVIYTKTKWIKLFMGINEFSIKYKYGKKRQETLKILYEAIKYAKDKKLKVTLTLEDSTRTKWKDLRAMIKTADSAGVDRLSVADTVGVLTPIQTHILIKKIKRITQTPLNIHCHNDFGMAVANSLVAAEAGVEIIDTCINGLGERRGISCLSEIILSLKIIYGSKNKWDLKILEKLSQKISKYSGVPIAPFPIETSLFTHTGGLHASAVLKNPEVYQKSSAKILGMKSTIIINEMSSIDVFYHYIYKIKKLKITDEKFNQLFKKLKNGQLKKFHGNFKI